MASVWAIHTGVRGRARFKVEGLYRCEALGSQLQSQLSEKKGIRLVSVSVLTGNILVLFHSERPTSEIAMLTEEVVCSYLQRQSPSKNEESHGLRGKDVSGFFRRKGNGGFRHGSPFLSSLIDYPSRKGQNRLHSHHPHKTIPSKAVPSKRKIRKLIVQGETQESRPWHVMDSDALLEDFGTGKIVGLSSEAARERLKRYGPNILPRRSPVPAGRFLWNSSSHTQWPSFPSRRRSPSGQVGRQMPSSS